MGLARISGLICGLSALPMLYAPAQNPPPTLPMIGNRLGSVWNPQPTNTLRHDRWLPDLAANSLTATTDRLYAAGSFAHFGQSTGCSAKLALSDAAVDLNWPRVDGPVRSIVSDGAGGWFLGGGFTLVESHARRGVAHVFPNGNVDAGFDAQLSGSDVRALLLANGVLYISGGIGAVGGAPRQALCAVDAQTGAILPWNPILGPSWNTSSQILSLAIHGDRIYAGGYFQQTVQGLQRTNLMLIDRVSALISPWDPLVNNAVYDMDLEGTDLVLGGAFTQILGAARSRVAVLDAPTGALGTFSTTINGSVLGLELDAGTLFLGGFFTQAAGQTRNSAAAFDFGTGALLPWDPNVTLPIGGNRFVNDIAVAGSDAVLIGCFQKVGADARRNVAIVDTSLGLARPWQSDLSGGEPNQAFCVAADATSAIVGGNFILANSMVRNGLCALALDDGSVTDWNPNAPGTRELIQVGDTVFLGGTLAAANGVPRRLLAAVDATTGTTTLPFDVTPSLVYGAAAVHAIAYGNGMLYAGGDFHTPAGLYSLIAVNPLTGALIAGWNTNIGGTVYDLALSADGTRLYVAGQFTVAGIPSVPRQNLAILDALTGALLPTLCNANAPVHCVIEASGRVFIGGDFFIASGSNVPLLAQLDPLTGLAYTWTPLFNPGGGQVSVSAIARYGRLIYVGGSFSQVNGVWSPYLGAVDAEYAIMANWVPSPSHAVAALAVTWDRVFVSGGFRTIGGVAMPYLASFEIH